MLKENLQLFIFYNNVETGSWKADRKFHEHQTYSVKEFHKQPKKIVLIAIKWKLCTQISFIWQHWIWRDRPHMCGLCIPSFAFLPTLTSICTNCVGELSHYQSYAYICMVQRIEYLSQIFLALTHHIHYWLRFMFMRIVMWGNTHSEAYFIWSNSCPPTVQYSHIRQMYQTFPVTQLEESSQLCGPVNWTGPFSACNPCDIRICFICV